MINRNVQSRESGPGLGIRDSQEGKNEDSAFMIISYYIYLNDNFYKNKAIREKIEDLEQC